MTRTFKGQIGRTVDESKPDWEQPIRAKKDAPNVLYIVLDDVGFGQLGCFGGLCETPNIDKIAERGLIYNNFHTTALCSPTRSCLLTGRNHHSNAMAGITEISTGYPGYNGRIPMENGFLSEMLGQHGYSNFAIGKWHLTPDEDNNMAAERTRWPLGRGFDRYYGFLGGETSQWIPDLVYDNHPVKPPKSYQDGYHLTEDLVDKGIEFVKDLKSVAPDKPFFMYFCTGACHAPHHVPKDWIAKFKGKFDMGWDEYRKKVHERQLEKGIVPEGTKLSPQNADVPEWSKLSDKEKKLYAHMMEVYAAFAAHTDHHIGRLLDFLKEAKQLDNTIIVLVSDNGASAEGGEPGSVNENLFFNAIPEDLQRNLKEFDKLGGPETYNHYPWGWAWAGNTPFRRWKRETYRGGSQDPCVISWPKGIKAQGEVRSQYTHAIDIVPTILEMTGIESPKEIRGTTQSPIEGLSFKDSLEKSDSESKHKTQYFEMFGHRSLYHDGWRAVCPWPGQSFKESGKPFGAEMKAQDLEKLEASGWELYHVDKDFSESNNVAKDNQDKLREMIERWWTEAGKYKVLPIDSRGQERFTEPRPEISPDRDTYFYWPGAAAISENTAVNVKNRDHTIAAIVTIPEKGAEGVLIAQGSQFGGYTLFVKDKKLHYVHNYVGLNEYKVSSDKEVPAGDVTLTYKFTKTGENTGKGELFFDDNKVGEGVIEKTTPFMYGLAGGGLVCGKDEGSPVSKDYQSPFKFTGKLERVAVYVGKHDETWAKRYKEALGRIAVARQ
ncbi:sulfatase-like hydrolase/transferase [Patescibacteria group bacterium]